MKSILLWAATAAAAAAVGAPARPSVSIPVVFEKNAGQTDGQVRFFGRANGARLWLVDGGAVFSVERENKTAVVRMNLQGARPHPRIEGAEPLPAKANYFTGNSPQLWRRDVSEYGAVSYSDVYPGIDLLFHASDRSIEYDWIISPGADPRQIQMSFEGADRIGIDSAGDLVLGIGGVEVRQRRPHLYQQDRDRREREVEGRFVLRGSMLGFEVGSYDDSRTLTIDPILTYATHIGGSGNVADQDGDYATSLLFLK